LLARGAWQVAPQGWFFGGCDYHDGFTTSATAIHRFDISRIGKEGGGKNGSSNSIPHRSNPLASQAFARMILGS
jgi:hypothetical protein